MAGEICTHHADREATWRCEGCANLYCDECIKTQNINSFTLTTCRECGERCVPIGPDGEEEGAAPQEPVKRSFFAALPGAFAYPFQGSGFALLVIGAIFFWALKLISFGIFGLIMIMIVSGFICAYLFKITRATANGEDEMPDWPSVADIADDMIRPYFLMLGTVAVGFFPVLVYALVCWRTALVYQQFVALGMLLLGMLYIPMGLMAVAVYDSADGLSPAIVIPAMFRTRMGYLVTCIVLLFLFLVRTIASVFISNIPVAIVPRVLEGIVSFYFLIVQMRILGLLFRAYADRLKWFENI